MVCMADTQPEANAPSLSTLPNCLKLEHNVQAKIQLSLSCTAALIPTNFLKMKRKDSCTSQNPAESVYYRSVYSAKNVWNFNIMFKSKLNTKFAHYSCVHSAKLPDIWMNQSNPCYVPVKTILSLICHKKTWNLDLLHTWIKTLQSLIITALAILHGGTFIHGRQVIH